MDLQKIGACLRELRKEKGLTQEQLAAHFNVSVKTVSRWENGVHMPDIELLLELADFYEVDLRALSLRFHDMIAAFLEKLIEIRRRSDGRRVCIPLDIRKLKNVESVVISDGEDVILQMLRGNLRLRA